MKYIDYGNSLLSLSSSVLSYYGVGTHHNTLAALDKLLIKNYKNLVVMLFDGMGTAILEKHLPKDAFLRRNIKGVFSSVFPPTTTAATLSMMTGLSPIEHGWLGWSLYFDEIGANVSIFPNTLSGSGGLPAADYNVAERCLPYKTIFEKINEASNGEVRANCVSPYSSYKSQSVEEIIETVKTLCNEDGRCFIYTYWPQPDYDMHELGTSDSRITNIIKDINYSVEDMCASLSDTLLVITADHGLVDTEWKFLSDYPDILECLIRAPSIETRACAFCIKDDMHGKFVRSFETAFGDSYILLSKKQVLSEGLFGLGEPNPRVHGMIGDYIAIATGNIGIDINRRPESEMFKAAHAGLTDDEINIPFIAVEL